MSLSRARLRMSGLDLGLENDDEPVEGGEASAMVEDTVEQSAIEVTEAAEQVEQHEEVAEQLEEAAESLESIRMSLEAALEEGGLDPQAATFLNHAVDAALKPIGVDSSEAVPSTESFGGTTGRLQATKVSLEGIKDWLEKIWTAIKNAVIKAITYIKDLFAKLFGGSKKLAERAKKLKEELGKLKDSTEKKEITFRSVGKLHLRGKADVGDFKTGMGNLTKTVVASFEKLPQLNQELLDEYSSRMTEIAKSGSAEAANNVHAKAVSDVTAILVKVNAAVKTVSLPLPGGVQVKTEGEGDKVSIVIVPTQKFAQISEEAKMAPLTHADIGALLDDVIAVAEVIEKKSDTVKKMAEARTKAVETYNKAVDEAKKKDYLQQGIVSWAMRGLQKDLSGAVGRISAHAFTSCRAALALCEKSIAAYDKK